MRWNVWVGSTEPSGWRWLGVTTQPSFLAENLPWGFTYTFAVSGDSAVVSAGTTVQITLTGSRACRARDARDHPVFDDAAVEVHRQGVSVVGRRPDPGIAGYEVRRGADWATGTVLFSGDATSFVWNA